MPRRRALFGLLDADGWGWASVKAFVWLIIIIFLLGYLPDRAYYFTVGRTVDLGVLVWSPINLCPPTNETLPCPAPVGALVPWQPSPRGAQPARSPDGRRRSLQVGTQILYIGGIGRDDGAVDGLRRADRRDRATSTSGPTGRPCPNRAPTRASPTSPGSIYVIGGADATGAPTTTVFVLSPDAQTGALGRVEAGADDLDAAGSQRSGPPSRSRPDGLLLIGGRNADGPVATTWKTKLNAQGALGAWAEEQPLLAPQADATAVVVGDYVWLYGGSDANGPVGAVQRGEFGQTAAEGLPDNPDEGKLDPVGRQQQPRTCPSPGRTRRAGAPTGRSTSPAATTAAARSPRSTGRSRRTTGGSARVEAPRRSSDLPEPGLEGAAGGGHRPGRGARRRRRRRRARSSHRASGPIPRRRARSSSSASSARRSPA